jgi:hypothetical protein
VSMKDHRLLRVADGEVSTHADQTGCRGREDRRGADEG